MTRSIPLMPALIILTATVSPAASVHVRQADGTWVELEATEQDGTVGFTITPDRADAGRALVVINKPDWMVLEDETPPTVSSYAIGGNAIEPDLGEGPLAIEGLGEAEEQRQVVFTIVDDANPVDAGSALLRIEGRASVAPEIVEESREQRSAKLMVDLNDFGPGAWQGTLTVVDLSPLSNTLEVPLKFSIAGAQIARDGQTATLSGGGAGFTARGDRRETIAVDAAGVSAFMTLQPEGQKHLYVREFANLEDRGSQAGWHIVDADIALEDIDGKAVTDEEVGTSATMRFAVHNDIPAVVVTSAATNLADAARSMYMFWGWLPGDGYVTSDGVRHEWSMSYDDVVPDRWILLPSKAEGEPGVGWISVGDFGESRFGTMILYTAPRKPTVEPGQTLEMTFALTPATDIEEVADVARRLVEEGALQLQMDE